jgi:predicted alpha/beta superfamily hydrolase
VRAALLAFLLAVAGPVHAASPDSIAVTFVVSTPAGTLTTAALWLSGDVPALGAWNGAGLALLHAGGGTYEGRLTLARGARIAYKVTRGGWDTVEKDAQGGEIGNRTLAVGAADTTVRIAVAAWRDQVEPKAAPRPSTLTGDIRHHAAFASKHVKARDVWVWLPPGYDTDTTRRYPVVYFQDGQNVFDRATSFLGIEWGVDETAGRLVRAGTVPAFIAVAMANTPDRMAEYTPAADARHGGGGAAAYGAFLVEELKPFVDATYRTDPRPSATAVVGSSLGANVSLWLGLERPDVFTRIGVVSPAAWFAGRDLVRRTAAGQGAGLRVWIDIGGAEDTAQVGRRAWVDDAAALRDALVARGYREGRDLHYEEVPGARHDEAAWAARVDRMLAFLLADLPRVEGK